MPRTTVRIQTVSMARGVQELYEMYQSLAQLYNPSSLYFVSSTQHRAVADMLHTYILALESLVDDTTRQVTFNEKKVGSYEQVVATMFDLVRTRFEELASDEIGNGAFTEALQNFLLVNGFFQQS